MIIIVMGVSGSGKSRIGALLAERLGCSFADGDAFHSSANREKMAAGIGLTDADRGPWLAAIRDAIKARLLAGETAVFACSSLKRAYRDLLRSAAPGADIKFVYLQGSPDLLRVRLSTRGAHFFDASLLQSQLDTLEAPDDEEALTCAIDLTPATIVDSVVSWLAHRSPGNVAESRD